MIMVSSANNGGPEYIAFLDHVHSIMILYEDPASGNLRFQRAGGKLDLKLEPGIPRPGCIWWNFPAALGAETGEAFVGPKLVVPGLSMFVPTFVHVCTLTGRLPGSGLYTA